MMRAAVLVISGVELVVIMLLLWNGLELGNDNQWALGQALSDGGRLIVLLAVAGPAFVLGLMKRHLRLAPALCGGLAVLVLVISLVTPRLSRG